MSAPTIETPRLLLRPWRASDYDAWAALSADARVMEFFAGTIERERALADAAKIAERLTENGYGWWVVEVKGGAPYVGHVALQDVPFAAHFTPALEVGWRLAAEFWGNGYATEGARAALAFAFQTLHRSEVIAMTAKINVRSQRVMQRLGMAYDPGDDFDNPRVADGSPLRPHVLFRIARDGAER